MPFKSQDQRKWMWANKPEMAKKWEAHTPDKKLPEKVSDSSKSSSDSVLHQYIKKHRKDINR